MSPAESEDGVALPSPRPTALQAAPVLLADAASTVRAVLGT